MKIFDLYETKDVKIEDAGLKKYINVSEKLVLKSHGRIRVTFEKAKINIVERLANLIAVPGSRGKRHKIITFWASGKYYKNMKTVLSALKIVAEKTGQNPIQVLVKAIENSAPCDEITTIEYGGARYPQSVDVSPLRRLNTALSNIVHGSYDKSFNKKTKIHESLADEIIKASIGSNESFAVMKKNESEKQANSAR